MAMTSAESENTRPQEPAAERSYRWLPTVDVQPGMSVARPLVGSSGLLETMYVAVGSPITTNTIAQLIVKGVECVAVFDTEVPDEAEAAARVQQHELRLAQIFGPQPDTRCQALMAALRSARPL